MPLNHRAWLTRFQVAATLACWMVIAVVLACLPALHPRSVAAAAGTVVWPFDSMDVASQSQRVDEGWDLQGTSSAQILAIADGMLRQANPNPGGFGTDYPWEQLDTLITGASGASYRTVYYGHVHVIASLIGTEVYAGEVIATANPQDCNYSSGGSVAQQAGAPCYQSNANAGWLEEGFGDSTPAGTGQTYPTVAGSDMKALLSNASVANTNPAAAAGAAAVRTPPVPSTFSRLAPITT